MSFIYPRTVSVRRPALNAAVGAQPYAALRKADETVIVASTPASIQEKTAGGRSVVGLPGDSVTSPIYRIFMPKVAKGTIKDRDIIVDEEGNRYQVTAAYWNSLGWNCRTQLLET